MALYRINQRNALFRGFVGDYISAAPDPIWDAAVKSGIVSRMDVAEPKAAAPEPEVTADIPESESQEKPTKKRRK